MDSITDYVKERGITAKVTKDCGMITDEEWSTQPYHAYRVQLRKPDGTKTPAFDWHQGSGITESPEDRPDSILDALISDAWSYIEAVDFDSWAFEFGYDSDSRKAERVYKACGKIADWLDTFLNGELEKIATEYERP